mmetsp:Transcript_26802/g.46732  ORF Transcript_26802/g.46732 Transcript_26802/m.46732 type:complete len:467 (+) Transcript_26802:549-1949(+)
MLEQLADHEDQAVEHEQQLPALGHKVPEDTPRVVEADQVVHDCLVDQGNGAVVDEAGHGLGDVGHVHGVGPGQHLLQHLPPDHAVRGRRRQAGEHRAPDVPEEGPADLQQPPRAVGHPQKDRAQEERHAHQLGAAQWVRGRLAPVEGHRLAREHAQLREGGVGGPPPRRALALALLPVGRHAKELLRDLRHAVGVQLLPALRLHAVVPRGLLEQVEVEVRRVDLPGRRAAQQRLEVGRAARRGAKVGGPPLGQQQEVLAEVEHRPRGLVDRADGHRARVVRHLGHVLHDAGRVVRVQPGGGLVQEEDVRLRHHAQAHRDPLELARGQPARAPAVLVGEPQDLQQLVDAAAEQLLRDAHQPAAVVEVLADGEDGQDLLELLHVGQPVAGHGLPVQQDLPRHLGVGQAAGQRVEQRGLARPRGAHQEQRPPAPRAGRHLVHQNLGFFLFLQGDGNAFKVQIGRRCPLE